MFLENIYYFVMFSSLFYN